MRGARRADLWVLLMAKFHAGELAVQARAGGQEMARRVGNGIRPVIPAVAQDFLHSQPILVAASLDVRGRPWASLLAGALASRGRFYARTLEIAAAGR